MKRSGHTALPVSTSVPLRRSGSTDAADAGPRGLAPPNLPGAVRVRACVGPPRPGPGLRSGAAAAVSRTLRNAVKRGRGPVLRAAAIAALVLVTAAYSSGRLGFDVTAEEIRLRFARMPTYRAPVPVRAYNAGAGKYGNAEAGEPLADGDADDRPSHDDGDAHDADDAKDYERPKPKLKTSERSFSNSESKSDSDSGSSSSKPSNTASAKSSSFAKDTYTETKEKTKPSPPKKTVENPSNDVLPVSGKFVFSAPRRLPEGRSRVLPVPDECAEWRKIASDPDKLHLYRKHFTSLDFSTSPFVSRFRFRFPASNVYSFLFRFTADWFLFVSMFTEQWHAKHKHARRRPVYVDVAANHARRWSNTYFFDRCMGWDGVCAEANPVYHSELRQQRHCNVIDTCVSDIARVVNFSFTAAYGGVVRDDKGGWGVDGKKHATHEKFNGQFTGFKSLTCTTLRKELPKLNMNHIDVLSLDVEGYELPVLEGIDWDKTTIDVLVVENKRPEIAALLQDRGFDRVREVLKDDIYIRKESGYRIDPKYEMWLKHLSKTDYKFHLP